MSKRMNAALFLIFTATTLLGFINAQAVGSKDLFRCRQSCYQKFVQDWHHCMDFEDCKNCWNNCDQQLGPFPLNINSALRQGSLVLTDIAWDQAITNASKQCLVTWEVSGGGLMGNLLTDSSTVELSLWSDTVYHVQVTCKHKETGGMRRSYKLIVDTHKLSDSIATGMQEITLSNGITKTLPNIYSNELSNSAETDSRMRILKDSSKDFLTPYNPNANVANTKDNTNNVDNSISSSSSTTDKSSSNINSNSINAKKDNTLHMNSVLRTKLIAPMVPAKPTDFLTQSMVFAVVGAVVVFFGLLTLYALTRPARKDVPAGASAIDKEVLIHSELLPSQTTAAKQQGAHTVISAAALTTVAADTRTLHV
ncbi:uncharacterized protein LOC119670410 [Teleopsis dalmanni]|uniref:uncharacterized protein LOC119670410 n=1 Tax=Teleopsis dalmanni TaxID=139649 RepID=UPI0018CF6209|nr:uncharacterized protein LOC119670410 [Teleopsis dalmanni]